MAKNKFLHTGIYLSVIFTTVLFVAVLAISYNQAKKLTREEPTQLAQADSEINNNPTKYFSHDSLFGTYLLRGQKNTVATTLKNTKYEDGSVQIFLESFNYADGSKSCSSIQINQNQLTYFIAKKTYGCNQEYIITYQNAELTTLSWDFQPNTNRQYDTLSVVTNGNFTCSGVAKGLSNVNVVTDSKFEYIVDNSETITLESGCPINLNPINQVRLVFSNLMPLTGSNLMTKGIKSANIMFNNIESEYFYDGWFLDEQTFGSVLPNSVINQDVVFNSNSSINTNPSYYQSNSIADFVTYSIDGRIFGNTDQCLGETISADVCAAVKGSDLANVGNHLLTVTYQYSNGNAVDYNYYFTIK